ncbi:MAG: hypothetical protein J6N77_02240 [Lachnospiraceae bacterium]|nr:hypothetical protein [Lachnospiraceae bacterium]
MDARRFGTLANAVHIVLGLGCILAFAISLWGGEVTMVGFPVLFLLAAILNFFTAHTRFRKDIRGRNLRLSGIRHVVWGVVLLILCYVTIMCVW